MRMQPAPSGLNLDLEAEAEEAEAEGQAVEEEAVEDQEAVDQEAVEAAEAEDHRRLLRGLHVRRAEEAGCQVRVGADSAVVEEVGVTTLGAEAIIQKDLAVRSGVRGATKSSALQVARASGEEVL